MLRAVFHNLLTVPATTRERFVLPRAQAAGSEVPSRKNQSAWLSFASAGYFNGGHGLNTVFLCAAVLIRPPPDLFRLFHPSPLDMVQI